MDDVILYIENAKESTKKLPELINEFARLQDPKSIHTQKHWIATH